MKASKDSWAAPLDLAGDESPRGFPDEWEVPISPERGGGVHARLLVRSIDGLGERLGTIPLGGVREGGIMLRRAGLEHAGGVRTFHFGCKTNGQQSEVLVHSTNSRQRNKDPGALPRGIKNAITKVPRYPRGHESQSEAR